MSVELDDGGVPRFTIQEGVAWDSLLAPEVALAAARDADAVCFGSLAQRHEPARSSVQALVAATPAASLRIFDVNLRQPYYSRERLERSLQLANVLKLNDGELPVLASLFALEGPLPAQLDTLARRFELRLVALTRADRAACCVATLARPITPACRRRSRTRSARATRSPPRSRWGCCSAGRSTR